MAAQGAVAVTSAGSAIVTANALGASGRGYYATVAALIAVCATGAMLGTPTFIVRAWPSPGTRAMIPTVSSTSFIAGTGIALAGGFTYLSASWSAWPWVVIATITIGLVLPATLAQVGAEQLAANLQRQHRFPELAARRAIWSCVPSIGAAVAAGATHRWELCAAALALLPAACVAAISVADARGGRASAVRPRLPLRTVEWRSIAESKTYRSALGSWLLLIILFLLYRLDVLLLGVLSTSSDVGIYSMSIVAAEIAWLFVNAKSVTLLPRLTQAARSQHAALVRDALLSSLIVTAVCTAIAAAAGRPVVDAVLSSEFARSYEVLLMLLPGVIAFVPVKIWITYTAAIGRNRHALIALMATLLLNVILNVILIPEFGALGAAAAGSISYVAAALLLGAWYAMARLSQRQSIRRRHS